MAGIALDRLPWLVLEAICEFLIDPDEYDDKTDLHAFALASKTCLEVATRQRFRQILLWPLAADDHGPLNLAAPFPRDGIRGWMQLLDKYDAWKHVRRLRVTKEAGDGARMKDVARLWETRHIFDVDTFLSPLPGRYKPLTVELPISANFLHLLSFFLSRATGLQDLVWAPQTMPRRILELLTTQLPRCRLHMHDFQLPGLWTDADGILQPISDQDRALVTSPNLYAIVTDPMFREAEGLYYVESLVMQMMGDGFAPNLQHVSLKNGLPIGETLDEEPPPPSKGPPGFPPHEDGEKSRRVALHTLSLAFQYGVEDEDLLKCGELTDLTKLRHLTISNKLNDSGSLPVCTLASQSRAGAFRSLNCLRLQDMDLRGKELSALNELLERIGPLQHLHLGGYMDNKTFDVILQGHGRTLHSLHLDPDAELEKVFFDRPKLFRMSTLDVQRLVDCCPHLTELKIPVSRSHGDANEVAAYRALARLGHLRRAWLKLYHWIEVDEYDDHDDDDDDDDDYFEMNFKVTLPHIKEAISNCAIDETLARSIFDMISGGADAGTGHHVGLRFMRLDIVPREDRHEMPGYGKYYLEGIMNLFTRCWVVERRRQSESRSASSGVVVTELFAETAEYAAKYIWPSHDEWRHDDRQKFKTAFEALWHPQMDKAEWWRDWHSFPLQESL